MSIFTPKISKSPNGVQEEASISFLKDLFLKSSVKTHLSENDKTANIDGYLELLDEEYRMKGKIAVQVKTVPPCHQGKNKFDCPTSLFGFAENTNDPVFLIAVDHKEKIALWKYINRSLIQSNIDKASQDTIIITFDDSEKLSAENQDIIISNWEKIVAINIELFAKIPILLSENEELRQKLITFNNTSFSINSSEVRQIQLFIDKLNDLYDNDFRYIKQLFYPKTWKRGIAVFEYSDSELSYALYSIKYGENSLLMKELSLSEISNFNDYSSRNCVRNEIKMYPEKLALKQIKLNVDNFLTNNKVLPLYYELANEYIMEFVNENYRNLRIDKKLLDDIDSFIEYLTHKFPHISGGIRRSVQIGNRSIPINILYGALQFLQVNGYKKIEELYPKKSFSDKTGLVCDLFTPENACIKAKYIFDIIPRIYDNFINRNFPSIACDLDLFYNADLVLIDMQYTGNGGDLFYQEHYISIYYLRCKESQVFSRDIIFSFNNDSDIYKENTIDKASDIFTKEAIRYKDITYEAFQRDNVDMYISIWDKNNMINTFYMFLNKRFNDYFQMLLK